MLKSDYSELEMKTVQETPLVHNTESLLHDTSTTRDTHSNLEEENNFSEIIKERLFSRVESVFGDLFERLQSPLEKRLFYCVIGGLVLALAIHGFGRNSMNGLTTVDLYYSTFIAVVCIIGGCIVDEVFFLIFDNFWNGPEVIKLYAHCLNGPVGFLIAVTGIKNWLEKIHYLDSINDWETYLAAIITVWACYTLKTFYHRSKYNTLLVNKFEARLTKMETQAKLLSVLASAKHESKRQSSISSFDSSISPRAATREDSSSVSLNDKKSALEKLKELGFVSRLQDVMKQRREGETHLKEVFTEIVEASKATVDEDESIHDPSEDRNFWTRLHAVSKGYLVVNTINGRLVIRRTKHALSFAKRLYSSLSRMGRRRVTGKRLCDIIQRDESLDEDTKESLTAALLSLFRVSNTPDSVASADIFNAACKTVFESYKYGASSLSDFGQVREQVAAVLDVIFWIFMVIVVQMIVKLDIDVILTPMLTLVFGVSFAVGPTVAQACMAISFVTFTLPYDVGDRIAVGVGSTKTICTVVSISLLKTTVITIYNEKLQWPNHILFSERIMNLTHSKQGTVELPVSFALNGPDAPSQRRITEFWRRITDYCMVEAKGDWASVDVLAHTFNARENSYGYTIWATSAYSFGQVAEFYSKRTLLVQKLRETQLALGITFMDITQPVDLHRDALSPDGLPLDGLPSGGADNEVTPPFRRKPRSDSLLGIFDTSLNIQRSESRDSSRSGTRSRGFERSPSLMKPRVGNEFGLPGQGTSPLPTGKDRSDSELSDK